MSKPYLSLVFSASEDHAARDVITADHWLSRAPFEYELIVVGEKKSLAEIEPLLSAIPHLSTHQTEKNENIFHTVMKIGRGVVRAICFVPHRSLAIFHEFAKEIKEHGAVRGMYIPTGWYAALLSQASRFLGAHPAAWHAFHEDASFEMPETSTHVVPLTDAPERITSPLSLRLFSASATLRGRRLIVASKKYAKTLSYQRKV